jgi:hypothetical protein
MLRDFSSYWTEEKEDLRYTTKVQRNFDLEHLGDKRLERLKFKAGMWTDL